MPWPVDVQAADRSASAVVTTSSMPTGSPSSRADSLPASRYRPVQWIELSAYTLLTLLLAGFSFWSLRRRIR